MKVNSINSYQNFKANNNDNKNSKSFMGHIADGFSDAIDGVSSAIDNTSKAAESLSDIAKSARNALSSPEEATIGVLTDQIDNKVVNNEKVPNWLRKTASYGTAVLAAGGTFIAIRKTPGVIKEFMVKNLNKFSIGKNILNNITSLKQSFCKFANAIGKDRINNILKTVGSYINDKTPSFIKTVCEKVKLNKLKDWTAGDYAKNIVATILGYQTGLNILHKNQNKFETKDKPVKETTTVDDENEFEEAA